MISSQVISVINLFPMNTWLSSDYFQGKSVLITGASSGIGEALARRLAAMGASLTLVARRTDRLEKIAQQISEQKGVAITLRCDVSSDQDLKAAVQSTLEKFGRLDIVIANAGFGVVGKAEKLTLQDYQRQFDTNIYGVLRTLYATLPELKKTRGQIVLLGSVASYVSLPGSSPYSMSKFAIRALAEALTDELRPQGIAVTLLSPGFIQSEIRRTDNQGQLRTQDQDPLPSWLPMSSQMAAKKMIRAIARRKREEIITNHGKFIVFIHRHFPWLIQGLSRLGLSGRREPTH